MKIQKKVAAALLASLCLSAMTGCGNTKTFNNDNNKATNNIQSGKNTMNKDIGDESASSKGISAQQLYNDLDLEGSVVDFNDLGCTITPMKTEKGDDGGEIAYEAAPGKENEEDNITVTYQKDCVFQTAVINATTGETNLSNASKENIKKQSSLIIYGEFKDKHHINASKIIIQRFLR